MVQTKRILLAFILVAILILANFSIVQGETLLTSAYVAGVIGHAQGYAISCESRSAADLAAFWGLSIGETEFLQALPRSDNPDKGFVGNPNDIWGRLPPHGYGVHADPVAETLRQYGLQAEAHHDLSWDDVRKEIIAGRPVIVWVIGAMWPGTPVDYQAEDGSIAKVAVFEHTMLLTGYSEESVEVIDAYSGQYQYYWLNSFLDSWAVLGNMAVFASGQDGSGENVPDQNAETYTVQPGDYLMQLARNFGTSWKELADMNSIGYPFTIFAGQLLRLPARISQDADVEPEPELLSTPAEPESSPAADVSINLPLLYRGPITGHNPAVAPTNPEKDTVKTVIVLHTDTLIGFGRSIGIAWHVLAELNNLPPTYVVHPGEILRVE